MSDGRQAAYTTVAQALKTGVLSRQPCEVCGDEAEAHHEDYAKPLDVVWLCKTHHGARHAEINVLRRAGKFVAELPPGRREFRPRLRKLTTILTKSEAAAVKAAAEAQGRSVAKLIRLAVQHYIAVKRGKGVR